MSAKPVYHSTIKENPLKNPNLERRRFLVSRFRRKALKHVYLIRTLLLFVGVLAVLGLFLFSLSLIRKTKANYYLTLVSSFIFTPDSRIKSIEGRTNLVLLGKAGQGHDAPDLTDTIMFISISHKHPSIVTVSVPRDIWIPELRAKLNSIYYWGNQRQDGGGLVLAKSSVEEIVGKPVHYGLIIDLDGFERVVDILGGIEVNVERGFVDTKYPISGREEDSCNGDTEYKCRYETIEFRGGMQTMDGQTVLKFVRSRNAEGDEGTDLARSARQQLVLRAVKDRILSREVILSPRILKELKEIIDESVETDIETPASLIISRRVIQVGDDIEAQVVPEKYLENPPVSSRFDNLYVFIPKNEDWTDIHKWIDGLFKH